MNEVRVLLASKIFSSTSMDDKGNTLLIICARNNLRKMAHMLITKFNCPVNVENLDGKTALDYSEKFSFDKFSKLLLSYGAERSI
jgi:ankyrin repeat protein